VTSETSTMAGEAGCLQGQDRSAVTHPSSTYARRFLIRLYCDNRFTRYTPPLAISTPEYSFQIKPHRHILF
ncbi:hypothetical protein J6590_102392, partial [Homalodisca vitripennis]